MNKLAVALFDLTMFFAFAWFQGITLLCFMADLGRSPQSMFLLEVFAVAGIIVLLMVILRWWFRWPARVTWATLAVGVSSLLPIFTFLYKYLTGGSLQNPIYAYPEMLIILFDTILLLKWRHSKQEI